MPTVTGSDFDAILADIGSYVPTRTGSLSYNSFGEGSMTHTAGSTLAIVQHLSERDDIVKEGTLNAGDLRVFIAGDSTAFNHAAGKDEFQIVYQAVNRDMHGKPVVHQVGSFNVFKELFFRTNAI